MQERDRKNADEVFLHLLEKPLDSRIALLAEMLRTGEIDRHIEEEVRELLQADEDAAQQSWLEPPQFSPPRSDGGEMDTESLLVDDTTGPNDAADQHPLSPIVEIPRYRIESELGTGGFGRVFAAFDRVLEERVALKVPKHRLESEAEIWSFFGEAKAVRDLQRENPHPNIIRVLNADLTSDGQPYIAMELIQGSSLEEELARRGGLPWEEAAQLLTAVARGMASAHKNRIVHRDLKPANILLDADGTPKVTDFGLAIRDDKPYHSREIAGTRAFMAPEQIRGETSHLQGDTDVWALGVILFQSVTNSLPFRDQKQIVAGRPKRMSELNSCLPQRLEQLCNDCLQQTPAQRPTAQEFADRLTAIVDQVPSPSTGESKVPKGLWGTSAILTLCIFAFFFGPERTSLNSPAMNGASNLIPISWSHPDFYSEDQEQGSLIIDSPAHIGCLQTHRPQGASFQYDVNLSISQGTGPAGIALAIHKTSRSPPTYSLIRIVMQSASKTSLRIHECEVKIDGLGHSTMTAKRELIDTVVAAEPIRQGSMVVKVADGVVSSLVFNDRQIAPGLIKIPVNTGCGVIGQNTVVFHQITCKEP